MGRTAAQDWPRRLRPLVLGAEPLDEQLRRRLGATVVAVGLLGGMALFLMAVFAGFGHGRIGLALAGLVAFVAAQVGASHLRLRRAVDAYRAIDPEGFEPPPGRPASG